jgi:hypothetical protein
MVVSVILHFPDFLRMLEDISLIYDDRSGQRSIALLDFVEERWLTMTRD